MRKKVAREAANLIYTGIEKEYKQAKLKAAQTHGIHLLPTNLEVAMALDEIAEEKEGKERKERLTRRRRQALELMKILEAYTPVLVGSVWRGTAHRESDIDIEVYHDNPNEVLETIKLNDLKVTRTEWTSVTKRGIKKTSFHIHLTLSSHEQVEIIVRSIEEINRERKCEIYGDLITGLNKKRLEEILQKNPDQRFVPY